MQQSSKWWRGELHIITLNQIFTNYLEQKTTYILVEERIQLFGLFVKSQFNNLGYLSEDVFLAQWILSSGIASKAQDYKKIYIIN